MNKLFATSLILLGSLWCQNSYGQLFDQRRNLSIGVNGGVNMSSVDFNPKIQQNGLLGTTFGFTARYMSEKYFKMMCGIQAEVNLSQRGWDEKIDDGTPDSYSRTLNYVEIPLFAHLAFGKDSNTKGLKFFVNLGPSVSFFLSDKAKQSATWDTSERPNNSTEQYGKAIENKFDYGILMGTGFELSTKIGHFILEGRYYFGLSDIYSSTNKDYFSRSGNSYYGARLAYLVDIFK